MKCDFSCKHERFGRMACEVMGKVLVPLRDVSPW